MEKIYVALGLEIVTLTPVLIANPSREVIPL